MQATAAKILELNDGVATVSVDRESVCARCASGKGCGAGLLGGRPKPVILRLPVALDTGLRAGDTVSLTMRPERLLKAAFLVYGLPLLGVVSTLSAGWFVAGELTDASAVGLAALGLIAGLVVARLQLQRRDCLDAYTPQISLELLETEN